jgi:hypothetical protein
VGDRRGFALGSLLIGAGLLGVVIGRSSVSRSGADDNAPPVASKRVADELTDTTPVAAPPPEEMPPPALVAEPAPPTLTAPLFTTIAPPAKRAAPAAPPTPAAPPAPPPAEPPPAVAKVAEPPTPPWSDPDLVQQGRVFNANSITSSSFDEEDVTEYDLVPDHEVTRSSFDDEDRRDSHPTGP